MWSLHNSELPNIFLRLPELFFGMRIRTFGHREKFRPRSLFVMNHVCHFDWLYFWGVVERNGNITTWKVVTKNSIKKVPILGGSSSYSSRVTEHGGWKPTPNDIHAV